MSDAYAIWRESDGMSKQRTVVAIWPELAAALSGSAVGTPPGVAGQPAGPPPECAPCRELGLKKTAIGKAAGVLICGACAGLPRFRHVEKVRL